MLLSPFVASGSFRSRLRERGRPDGAGRARRVRQVAPVIDRTYPLGETIAAIRHLLDGHARGKVVIAPSAQGAVR